jgi:hypothetical protein
MAETTIEQLQSELDRCRQRLAAMPNVVGWGVGLDADKDPLVQVFVSAPPSDALAAELGRLFDRYEVVVQTGPAEAD